MTLIKIGVEGDGWFRTFQSIDDPDLNKVNWRKVRSVTFTQEMTAEEVQEWRWSYFNEPEGEA